MTSTPASRSALATTLAPRSCPSRPGLAMITRMLTSASPAKGSADVYGPLPADPRLTRPGSELLDRGVAQDEVLDPVIAAEVDLRLRVVAAALHGQDPAQAVGVVVDHVTRGEHGHRPGACRVHVAPAGQPLGRGRRGGSGVPPPLDQLGGHLGQEPGLLVVRGPAEPGPGHRAGQVQPLLGPGDAHVGEPALLLELPLVAAGALV